MDSSSPPDDTPRISTIQRKPNDPKTSARSSPPPSRGANLYIKWKIDRGSFVVVVVFCVPTVLQYSTVQFCCTCAANKNTRRTTGTRRDTHHGHYTGNSSTGTSRPRTEVLRTRTYSSAANTLLRSRASRGHLNLCTVSTVNSSQSC
jgi:hypothetical protein